MNNRIVSLVPSLTELLYDLGLENRIVGITPACVHPYHFASVKTIVGASGNPDLETVQSLKPDVILTDADLQPTELRSTLESIAPIFTADVRNLNDNSELISNFGKKFNCRTESAKILDKIQFSLTGFESAMKDRPIRKSAYFLTKDPYIAAGSDTFIDALLQLNRFENIYAGRDRFPEVIVPKLRIQGDPELILLPDAPFPFSDTEAFEIGRSTHHAKTVFVRSEMFSWYGSRLLKAMPYFRTLQDRLG